MGGNAKRWIQETDFLFSLTNNFSNAFEIKRERIRNWRMVGIVLNKEKEGSIETGILRRAIKPLILKSNSSDSLHGWLNKFVSEFGNDDGLFLDRRFNERSLIQKSKAVRQRTPNTTHFILSERFKTCAITYVNGLLKYGEFAPNSPVDIDASTALRATRALFAFQNNRYWKLWVQLIADIGSAASANGKQVDRDEDKLRLIHWVIMLIAWRAYLKDPTGSLDRIDINKEATTTLLVVDPVELSEAIDFWSSEKGGTVLKTWKQDKTERYLFNNQYESVFETYITAAIALRPRWREEFARALRQGPSMEKPRI